MEESFEKTKFAKGGGTCFECCDYEGMYTELKELYKTFATRIVEEVGKELIGSDDDVKILIAPMFKIMAKIRNQLRQEQRTKLQKMKEI